MLLLLLLILSATCFLVLVLCFEVSEPHPYTKGGHNVYIAKKREMMTKNDKNSDIQKRKIFLNYFEKSTLIGTIIVILTGLITYGHISRGIFGSFSYPLLMFMRKVFQEYSSTCVIYLGKQS